MKTLAWVLALALAGTLGASGGFGEFAGTLNFTPSQGSSQTLSWGIMNAYDYPLQVTTNVTSLVGPSPMPKVSIDPTSILLNATTILNADVSVDALGVGEGVWTGTLTASTPPLSNETGVAVIAQSTIKKFTIDTACKTRTLVSPDAGIVGLPCTRLATRQEMVTAGIWKAGMWMS